MKFFLLAAFAVSCFSVCYGANWCYSCTNQYSPSCGDSIVSCASGVCTTQFITYPTARTSYSQGCYTGNPATYAGCVAGYVSDSTDASTMVRTQRLCCSGAGCNLNAGSTQYSSDLSGPAEQSAKQDSTAGDPPGQLCYNCNSDSDPEHCGATAKDGAEGIWCSGKCYTSTDSSADGKVRYQRGCDDTCNVGGVVGQAAGVNGSQTSDVGNSQGYYQACCTTTYCNSVITAPSGSIRCYECDSNSDERCGRQGEDDWKGETLEEDGLLVHCMGSCYKSRSTGKNIEYIVRGCSATCEQTSTKAVGVKTSTKCCDTDSCNSAGGLQMSLFTIVGLLAAKMM